ncbi:MAG: molecular chaperone DnaJ [Heliobacteriaceae bacterium]|jgi:molecular chaperone DnaJ|nr:molecular chaperone DnaJ [Heliobacteriaceae bacterium]
MTDYYEILEVSKEATKEEIKNAFRKKARTLHPDVNKSPDAGEKFKELGKAYETLSDDNKRATYDRYGEDGLKDAGFDTGGPFAAGFGDLNEILSSLMSGMGFGGNFAHFGFGGHDTAGDDLRLDIEIEFEQAVFGVNREIKFEHLETCPSCHGTGAEKGSRPVTCPKCHGSGQVKQVMRTPLGSFAHITMCPECAGSGQVINNPCKDCRGCGRVRKEKTVEIRIPAGVDNMSKIRLSGEGDAGLDSARAGDLFVVIHVKQSDYFKRDGNNIFTGLEITPAQAVLGDEVSVRTLDGETKVHIHAGIQSGNSVKIRNAGVPFLSKPSHRGDHVIIVSVRIPTHLSEEEKNLYRKLHEINGGGKKPQTTLKDKIKGAFNA